MAPARSVLAAGLLSLPGLALAAAGVLHLHNGRAVNAAFPVPLYQSLNIEVPRKAADAAAAALSDADRHDGTAQLARAQVLQGASAIAIAENGLAGAPASADGWLAYARLQAPRAPRKAAAALDQAFQLSPYDYYHAGDSILLAARLWPVLSQEVRQETLRRTRLMWEEPLLREQMYRLLSRKEGVDMTARAWTGKPEQIRAINRWNAVRARQP